MVKAYMDGKKVTWLLPCLIQLRGHMCVYACTHRFPLILSLFLWILHFGVRPLHLELVSPSYDREM